MRTISFLSLILTVALGCSPALSAEECTGITKELRATTLSYRASINEFRAAKSSLDVDATEEFRLRAHRRMVLAQRELRDQRGRLLELYEALVKSDCPPFDPNASSGRSWSSAGSRTRSIRPSAGSPACRRTDAGWIAGL